MSGKGKVKVVKADKGFGFIEMENGNDIFFHATGLASGVEFDERLKHRYVEFEIVDGPKGTRAIHVRPSNWDM